MSEREPADLKPQLRLLSTALALSTNACGINVLTASVLGVALWLRVGRGPLLVWLGLMLFVQSGRFAAACWLRTHNHARSKPRVAFQVLQQRADRYHLGPGVAAVRCRTVDGLAVVADDGERRAAGVGLAICRELVDLHAGHIWAEPCSPGACFRFWLPMQGQVTETAA